MADNFKDIYEELNWHMILLSEGNPYIVDEFVRQRNAQRSMQNERIK